MDVNNPKNKFLQIKRLKDFDNIGVENVGLSVLLTVKKLSIIKKGVWRSLVRVLGKTFKKLYYFPDAYNNLN